MFGASLALLLNLPTLRSRRRALAATSGGNVDQLRRRVRANGAWFVRGESRETGLTSVVTPWTGLEDHISRCAATKVPDLVISTGSPPPKPRRHVETVSAILVPDPGAGAVVVLVRYRRKPFRPNDLNLAVAWLHDHRPDGAPEPLVVGMAGP
jgi:hypothetical protein